MKKSGKKGNKAKTSKTGLFKLLKPYRGMISLLIVFALISNAANLVIPQIISHGIDSYSEGNYVFKNILTEFLVAAGIIFFFTMLQTVVQTYASERVGLNLRKNLSDKISRQSFAFIQEANPSKLLTNLTSDMDSVKMFVSVGVSSIVSSTVMIIGTAVFLLIINWKLAIPVLFVIPLVGITFFIILKKVRVLFMRGREVIDWLNKVINESILGAAIIRVINSQQQEYRKFLEASAESRDIGISIVTLFATLIPLITFFGNLATLTILVLGGHLVITGNMSLGDFAAFTSYVAILIFPIIVIGFISNMIAQASASYERIESVLKAEETADTGTIDHPLKGNIDIKNVSVFYDGKPALKNVSFSIKPGSRTAIIGPTAAGKSQLLYLFTSLIQPDEGTVEFDGTDIKKYNKKLFHTQVGFVFQDSVMFNMSLRENIAFSDVVTDQSLQKAIDTAELKDFIGTLPKKLDTLVSERGTSLSGGQKQRIMLARALALNPKILLLDDFTARVDQQTEQKILNNIRKNYPDLTLISVTQKISPVKDFDQILLLMEGELIAAGKHDDLRTTSPEYVQIYESQKAPAIMSYNLDMLKDEKPEKKKFGFASVKSLVAHMVEEKKILVAAFIAMVIAALLNLAGPILIGHAVDNYIQTKQYHGLLIFGGILLGTYIVALVAGYLQTRLMGGVGQRMLYTLRNSVFEKLQELPYDFFNQNKTGDLISRINNDTDKINQFFSQSLMQFLRVILIMAGAGIFLVSIFWKLGLAALSPAIVIWLFTKIISPWVKRKNAESLKSVGHLSSEVQESLNNFKVVVAFNRRDYFRQRFALVNRKNYSAAVKAGIANNLFLPVYTLFANLGLMIVLTLGIYFISVGQFTVGLLISFIAYVNSFYNPLRQLASLWANFQTALAAWDRIRRILELENNLPQVETNSTDETATLVSFRDVSFSYPNGSEVLHNITFNLKKGKTYAFVGPTGGGKTTTASLISRLYDPTKGKVLLDGKDIRSFSAEERVSRIGFILQDPFLFSGTIRDNILYGNEEYKDIQNEELEKIFHDTGLEALLQRFEKGLDTKVNDSGDGISLGQKQLIAFMRAVLRKPDLLILDEATANIDTVTEQLLDEIIQKLPNETTKVIIAHRLNTIANADVIYFVNTGKVTRAGSLKDAVDMLMKGKMAS